MSDRPRGRFAAALWVILLLTCLGPACLGRVSAQAPGSTLPLTITCPEPAIVRDADGWDDVMATGIPRTDEIGQPALPYRPITIVLPECLGAEAIVVEADPGRWLAHQAKPRLAEQARPLGLAVTAIDASEGLANAAGLWPPSSYVVSRQQRDGGVTLLTLRLYPYRWNSTTGGIWYVPRFVIRWSNPAMPWAGLCKPTFVTEAGRQRLAQWVDNPGDLAALGAKPPPAPSADTPLATVQAGPIDLSVPHDYVIIAPSAFHEALAPLLAQRSSQGLSPAIVAIEDIVATYDGLRPDGGRDDATRLRQFLQQAYQTWNTGPRPLRYVLLLGDTELVPARAVFARAGIYETSAENPLLCDGYFAGLDGTWDDDRDGQYGEGKVSEGGTSAAGEEADLYPEIAIGRVPASLVLGAEPDAEVRRWLAKQLRYEAGVDADRLHKALWLGEQLDNTTNGGLSKEPMAALAPQLEIERLYDRDGAWQANTLLAKLNANVHIVNHLGHANASYVMRLGSAQVDQLTNTLPFLLNTQGCLAGAFGVTKGDAIAERLITAEHAAFAVIANTNYGWYLPNRSDGASQLYDTTFFDALYAHNVTHLGDALGHAKLALLPQVGAVGPMRWANLEITLFGDPFANVYTEYLTPVAQIAAPLRDTRASTSVTISGTAAAGAAASGALSRYELAWGAGLAPEAWQTFATGSHAVRGGVLAQWDVAQLADGPYSLRLTVTDSTGASAQDTTLVEVRHALLSAPAQGAFLGNEPVDVLGTASCAGLISYTLEARTVPGGTWQLISVGHQSVNQDTLGRWAVGVLPAGRYKLALTVYGASVQSRDEVEAIVDHSLVPGWPAAVRARITNEGIAVADLDHDGQQEVIATEGMFLCGGALDGGRCGRDGMLVYVWDAQGRVRPGWPRMPGSDNRLTAPTVGDIDGDGQLEILVGSIDGHVYAFEPDGEPVTGWPKTALGAVNAAPTCADLTGDGRPEVIVADDTGQVHAWSGAGFTLAGWPQSVSEAGLSAPGVLCVDLDGDGRSEIVAADNAGWVRAWDAAGATLPGWPIATGTPFYCAPMAADLDRNGSPEIVAIAFDRAFAWDGGGRTIDAGWPKALTVANVGSPPALVDLDNDGRLDVLFVNALEQLSLLTAHGTEQTQVAGLSSLAKQGAPIVGDITGDCSPEVLVAANDASDALYVIDHQGQLLTDWGHLTTRRDAAPLFWERRSSPILCDLDGDGQIEIGLGVEQAVFFWHTNSRCALTPPWPAYRADFIRSGAAPMLAPSKRLYLALVR